MDLLFSYHQQKKDKHRKPEDNVAQCLIRLYIDNDNICYEGMFDFDYDRYGSKIHVTFDQNEVLLTDNSHLIRLFRSSASIDELSCKFYY